MEVAVEPIEQKRKAEEEAKVLVESKRDERVGVSSDIVRVHVQGDASVAEHGSIPLFEAILLSDARLFYCLSNLPSLADSQCVRSRADQGIARAKSAVYTSPRRLSPELFKTTLLYATSESSLCIDLWYT